MNNKDLSFQEEHNVNYPMASLDSSLSTTQESFSAEYYLPMVRRLAKNLVRRLPQKHLLDDLIGAGVVGLLEAMGRFDPSIGKTLTNFVEFRIRGAMLDELRRYDMMARDARMLSKRIEHAIAQHIQQQGDAPEEKDLAEILKIDQETLQQHLSKVINVRLTSFEDSNKHSLSFKSTAFDKAAQKELRQRLAKAIAKLQPRLQQILKLYYQQELTLKEIGVIEGVSESRACQLLSMATHQLRVWMQEKKTSFQEETSIFSTTSPGENNV